MAVKVTLTTREVSSTTKTVDVYDHEDDAYWVSTDGKTLQVHVHDRTVTTYPPGSWSKVEGKQTVPGTA